MRKDLLDRKLYFHHRPIAATAQYRGSRVSHAFEPIVSQSIRDFHGIGLFVEETRILKAEKLRTLVLIFKNNVLMGRTGLARASSTSLLLCVVGRGSYLIDWITICL